MSALELVLAPELNFSAIIFPNRETHSKRLLQSKQKEAALNVHNTACECTRLGAPGKGRLS